MGSMRKGRLAYRLPPYVVRRSTRVIVVFGYVGKTQRVEETRSTRLHNRQQ